MPSPALGGAPDREGMAPLRRGVPVNSPDSGTLGPRLLVRSDFPERPDDRQSCVLDRRADRRAVRHTKAMCPGPTPRPQLWMSAYGVALERGIREPGTGDEDGRGATTSNQAAGLRIVPRKVTP